ncbi:hypothetical protein M0R19_00125 [Candidatus Pacearchaeota archaeon]|jgi:Zn-dependent protease|nr:hypothetical protein [Candidatus Pacearchaeota archaeon]
MINKREMWVIPLVIIIVTLSLNLSLEFAGWYAVLGTLAAVTLVILLNIFAKKIIAYNLDSEIEMKIWEFEKLGKKIKNFPIGAILPILSKLILFPFKSFVWMACFVFDVKPRIYRGAKRHGLYTFSEITEYHLGLIAASGIVISLISAIVGYLLGFPLFARLSIYYAFFNILPISELDGNKIFFGSLILWSFLASLVLIGMLFAMLIV